MVSKYVYDLEDRTLELAKRISRLCRFLSKDIVNTEYIKQIIRSGSSVGANYREANEALGKKDFLFRLKISRKECKETIYWVELIIESNQHLEERIKPLLSECIEIRNILSKIILNIENK
jgi:four helix bundle protein